MDTMSKERRYDLLFNGGFGLLMWCVMAAAFVAAGEAPKETKVIGYGLGATAGVLSAIFMLNFAASMHKKD